MVERHISSLPGMGDLRGAAYDRSRSVEQALSAKLTERGYEPIDTPLVEETELFVRKSGGELTGRLYSFIDPGRNQVSLRPEFTSSVIRHFVQERKSLTLPVRWRYSGPVFRYEPEGPGGSSNFRQFTQLGAEIVGAGGLDSDVEVVSLAAQSLELLGLGSAEVRMGHLGLLYALLGAFGLSEPAKLFIVANIQALKRGDTSAADLLSRAQEVGLLRAPSANGLQDAMAEMSEEGAQAFVQGVLRETMPAPMGRRTSEQIVERLLRKTRDADDPKTFEEALDLVSGLSGLDGEPTQVLVDARAMTPAARLPGEAFDEVERLFSLLSDAETGGIRLVLDMGLARGISYYTGMIFELLIPSTSGEVSLGGGGRYDGLVRALGGDEDVPALGFAFNLNRLIEATESQTAASKSDTTAARRPAV